MFIQLTEPTTYDFPALVAGAANSQNIEIAHAVDISGYRLVGLAMRLHSFFNLSQTSLKAVGTAVWPLDGEPWRFEDTAGPALATAVFSTVTAVPGTMHRTSLVELASPFVRVVVNAEAAAGATAGSITVSVGLLLEPM